jgi:hypothetical protein
VPVTGSGRQAQTLHHISKILIGQAGEQLTQEGAVGLVETIVGVQPEDPVAAGRTQALIARGGEAILDAA